MTHKASPIIIILVSFLVLPACTKSLVVKNVDYTQRIESVLKPDSSGIVNDIRNGITYSILPIQYEEFQDTTRVLISEVRMIRNNEGYYFITADHFKHVYVMEPKRGSLILEKKILVKEDGLNFPALNARNFNIQLVELYGDTKVLLNQNGITKMEGQS